MDLKVGKKYFINDSIGEVVLLYIHSEYLIMLRLETGQFIKANGYEEVYNKIVWNSGEYFNSFIELALDIAEMVDKTIGLN